MMKLQNIRVIGLTSLLLCTTIGGILTTPELRAESLRQITPINTTFDLAQASNAPQTLASGSFVTVEQNHPTTGKAEIVEHQGKKYLKFDSQFTTATGPAVKVVLHTANSVGVKLNEKDYITVAPLTSFNGQQLYELPNNIDLDSYQSVVIWCERFNVTFGYAALSK